MNRSEKSNGNNYHNYSSESLTDEITLNELMIKLRSWWRYLQSKWILIFAAGVIGGTLGLAYAFSKKPVYTAELTFVLEGGNQGGGLGNYAGLASQFGINMGTGDGQGVFEGENFLALMRSRFLVQKALLTTITVNNRKITLAEYYIEMCNLREKWAEKKSPFLSVRFLPESNPSHFSIEQNALITSFHNSLIVNNLFIDKQDKKSGIIVLKVKSENELFSKYFAEVLTKEVSEFYVETKTKKSADNLKILQHQTDSIRRALSSSMTGAAISADANPNMNPARQILRVPSQRRQGDVAANQAILGQLVQNLEIAKMTLRIETPLIQVIDRPILPLAETSVSKLRSLIIGGVLGIFILVIYLTFRKIIGNIFRSV